MPTYVYACSACAAEFEVEQRITESPLETCQCGSQGTVKRLIQPVGVMFKGAGFHINDYSSSAAGGSAPKKEAPAATGEACTGEPKSCGACAPKADA